MKKLLLLFLLPVFMFASIGKITALTGEVKIKRDSGMIMAVSGTEIKKNDFISTSKDGKVQIIFSDKTVFTIGKNSTLDIADYLYDESKPKKNKAKFNVLKGAFSSITGRIGKLNKSKFKLKTKSASIGIRGTALAVSQEVAMCTDGAISVEKNGISVRVEAGQKTFYGSDTPGAPTKIKPGDVESLELNIQNKKSDSALKDKEEQKTNGIAATPKANANSEIEDTQTDIIADGVTLDGRSISSSGSNELVTVKGVQTEKGFMLDPNSGLQMVDDDGKNIKYTDDSTITWGHWADDPSKKWVAGEQTDVKVLDDMRNNTEKTVSASYNGKVMGTVNGTDDIKMDSTNKLQVNVNLGAGTNSVDSTMQFQTNSGSSWNAQFAGTTSGNSFSAGATGGQSDGTNLTAGGMDGNFYGDNAQAVGGTWELQDGTNKATGAFKASQ
jgi:hypothetical protein